MRATIYDNKSGTRLIKSASKVDHIKESDVREVSRGVVAGATVTDCIYHAIHLEPDNPYCRRVVQEGIPGVLDLHPDAPEESVRVLFVGIGIGRLWVKIKDGRHAFLFGLTALLIWDAGPCGGINNR